MPDDTGEIEELTREQEIDRAARAAYEAADALPGQVLRFEDVLEVARVVAELIAECAPGTDVDGMSRGPVQVERYFDGDTFVGWEVFVNAGVVYATPDERVAVEEQERARQVGEALRLVGATKAADAD